MVSPSDFATRVELSMSAGVARIVLDGPRTRNALDADSAQALVAACDSIDADPAIGVAVIEGRHGAFCSGAARHILKGLADAPAGVAYEQLGLLYAAFARVRTLTVPTVAIIDGPAVGAGLNLALVADVRVATPSAQFMSGFAANNIHPGGGHLHLLADTSSRQTAAAIGLFNQALNASDAQSVGLVWRCVPAADLEVLLREFANHLASDPALARATKASLNLTCSSIDQWSVAVEVERARQMWSLSRNRSTQAVDINLGGA